MILIAYMLVFVLPMIAILAVARTVGEEAPGERDAVILNVALLFLAVATLAVIDLVLL